MGICFGMDIYARRLLTLILAVGLLASLCTSLATGISFLLCQQIIDECMMQTFTLALNIILLVMHLNIGFVLCWLEAETLFYTNFDKLMLCLIGSLFMGPPLFVKLAFQDCAEKRERLWRVLYVYKHQALAYHEEEEAGAGERLILGFES